MRGFSFFNFLFNSLCFLQRNKSAKGMRFGFTLLDDSLFLIVLAPCFSCCNNNSKKLFDFLSFFYFIDTPSDSDEEMVIERYHHLNGVSTVDKMVVYDYTQIISCYNIVGICNSLDCSYFANRSLWL